MAKGDCVYVYRNFGQLSGFYKHYGIDCGDNTVIHYRKPSETIERTSLATFSRGNPVYVAEYSAGFGYIPEVVVARAESRLGEQEYNLITNNCEHFAHWCKTGMSYSKQVSNYLPTIRNLDISKLYEPIKQALQGKDNKTSARLTKEALTDIESVWNQVQPKYKEAIAEMQTWSKVAKKALEQEREDLARGAIARKLSYEKQARKYEIELGELAEMTENLVRTQQELVE
ncbi:MAG: lecithin retinol acyltransferase family protein [Cyanobacteria bacterium P01_G01_bin.39]